MEPITISIKETTKVLSLCRTKIYSLINDGSLDAVKLGRRTLIKTDSVRRLIEELTNDQK